jgi:signal transduction histidine kinase/ligand-binding sensor domain-containing protein
LTVAARLLVVLIGATALQPSLAAAQPPNPNTVFGRYQQAVWQERDGLPQNSVLAIAMTRDGYLWIGTYEGAARFDGARFTLFKSSNTTGLGNSLINDLLETRDGSLWLATYGGGVSRYADGRFTQYAKKQGLASDFVTSLFEDQSGTLWIATDGGGVSRFHDGRFTSYTTEDGLPSNAVRRLTDDGEGGLLAGTTGGIGRISSGRVVRYEGPAEVATADILMLRRTRDGALWVSQMGRGRGLYRIGPQGMMRFGPADGLADDYIEAMSEDGDGTVWLGSPDGLFRYADGRLERYGKDGGLPAKRVTALAKSRDGNLWVGTDGGLVRFRVPRFTLYTERDGLTSDVIGSLLQDVEGTMWVEAGFRLHRVVHGRVTRLSRADGLPNDRVNRLALGADGHVLVGTEGGLARWQHGRFVLVDGTADVPWTIVRTFIQDRRGTLWFGIVDGGVLRIENGRRTILTTADGLADNVVLSLFEDQAGSIWVGTLRNGVTRISNGQLTSWSADQGIAANHVKAFHQDATGTLWIGTHGGGLTRFKDGRFASVSARQGLYNDDIFRILEDDDGNLWMNCNTGIWRTSMEQLNAVADGRRPSVESFAYGTADGMLSAEGVGTTIAGWKLRDGSLWFPTIKGVVAFDPRRRDAAPPHVLIERVTLDREQLASGTAVRLAPDRENLEIEYTGLSWERPHAIRFRYRMVGLDREWVEAGPRRTAYYSHLPPGSYTFTVMADNGEGVWSDTAATLAIVVQPRLYQTWWFIGGIALALVVTVWGSVRYRIAQIRRVQAAQQAFSRQLIDLQERERKRIAAELHDSLGQSLLVVKNRALLGAMSQPGEHALAHFQEIGAAAAHTLDEVRAISYNLRPHHLDQLGLTTTIGALIETIGKSAGIEFTRELDDIDGLFPPSDEITIYRIVQESLNNVVKHSRATAAHVVVRSHEHEVEIVVRDNGQGFRPRDSRQDAAGPGGFGLTGIAERVQMLGGTHTIESSPGQGTTLRVRIVTRGAGRDGNEP